MGWKKIAGPFNDPVVADNLVKKRTRDTIYDHRKVLYEPPAQLPLIPDPVVQHAEPTSDLAVGRQRRDEGMDAVAENNPTESARIHTIIDRLFAEQEEVCADDVRRLIDWEMTNPNILGAAFGHRSRRKEIVRTRPTQSTVKSRNAGTSWYWKKVQNG